MDLLGNLLGFSPAATGSQQLIPQHLSHQQQPQHQQSARQLLPHDTYRQQLPQQQTSPSAPNQQVHSAVDEAAGTVDYHLRDSLVQQLLELKEAPAAAAKPARRRSSPTAFSPLAGTTQQQEPDWLQVTEPSAQPVLAAMASADAEAALEAAATDADAAAAEWMQDSMDAPPYLGLQQLVVADAALLTQLAVQLNPGAVGDAAALSYDEIGRLETLLVEMEDDWRYGLKQLQEPAGTAHFQTYSGLCAAVRPVQLSKVKRQLLSDAQTAASRPELGLVFWVQSLYRQLFMLRTTDFVYSRQCKTPAGQRLQEIFRCIVHMSELMMSAVSHLQEHQPALATPAAPTPAPTAAPATPATLMRSQWQAIQASLQAAHSTAVAGSQASFLLETAAMAADDQFFRHKRCRAGRSQGGPIFIAETDTVIDLAQKLSPAVSQAAELMDRSFGGLRSLPLQLDDVAFAPGQPLQPAQLQSYMALSAAVSAVEVHSVGSQLQRDISAARSDPANGLVHVLRSCAAQLRRMHTTDLRMPADCPAPPS